MAYLDLGKTRDLMWPIASLFSIERIFRIAQFIFTGRILNLKYFNSHLRGGGPRNAGSLAPLQL